MSTEELRPEFTTDSKVSKLPKNRLSWSAWFSIIIVLLVLFWLGFAAYQMWWFKNQATTSWARTKADVWQLSQMQTEQAENITANQMAIQQVLQFKGQQAWQIQQASYLIQLASAHLFLQQDLSAALILLRTAERDLHGVQSAKWQSVSQALATTIASLQSQTDVNVLNVYQRLQSASLQVDALSLPSKLQVDATTDATKKTTGHQSVWKTALNTSWQMIQQVLVIRHHDDTVQPILTDDQQQVVRLHLTMLLMQAEWAALQHQSTIYQTALATAQVWVKRYFLNNDRSTQTMLQALSELSKQKVTYQLSAVKTLSQTLLQAMQQTQSKEKQ